MVVTRREFGPSLHEVHAEHAPVCGSNLNPEDAAFIAHAPDDIRALFAVVDALVDWLAMHPDHRFGAVPAEGSRVGAALAPLLEESS